MMLSVHPRLVKGDCIAEMMGVGKLFNCGSYVEGPLLLRMIRTRLLSALLGAGPTHRINDILHALTLQLNPEQGYVEPTGNDPCLSDSLHQLTSAISLPVAISVGGKLQLVQLLLTNQDGRFADRKCVGTANEWVEGSAILQRKR